MRQWAQPEIQAIPLLHKTHILHCQGGLTQVAQRDCGVSILGDFQLDMGVLDPLF